MAKIFVCTDKKGFTLIELMVTLTTIVLLAGTAMPMFLNYSSRTKSSEAVLGLSKMTQGEVAYQARTGNYIEAGPINIPPTSTKTTVDFSTDPRWGLIAFEFSGPIYFGYQAVMNGTNAIDCEALGDLNGNTVLSTFRRTVRYADGNSQIGGLFTFDELE